MDGRVYFLVVVLAAVVVGRIIPLVQGCHRDDITTTTDHSLFMLFYGGHNEKPGWDAGKLQPHFCHSGRLKVSEESTRINHQQSCFCCF